MNKIYAGCDLGVNGGFVFLDETGNVLEVFKTPVSRKDFIHTFYKYNNQQCFCLMEKVGAMPQNGVKAMMTFGMIVERTQFALEMSHIPYQEITPQQWMKSYMLKKTKGESNTKWKNRLKAKAQQLFPGEKVTLWNADAYLIAEYCRRDYK